MPATLAALPATRKRLRIWFVVMLLFQCQYSRSRNNQKAAGASHQSQAFAEKDRRKQDDEGHTQLIDGGDARGFSKLERAEVAEPRKTGGQTGEHQEDPGSRCQAAQRGKRCSGVGYDPGEDQND